MIKDRVTNILSIKYEKRLLVFDINGFANAFDYLGLLKSEGFCVVMYTDVEAFRLRYEVELKNSPDKWAVIVTDDIYVPYDIRIALYEVALSMGAIFPKLDETVVARYASDLDIVSFTYDEVYDNKLTEEQTQHFLESKVFAPGNVSKYCGLVAASLLPVGREKAISYSEWFDIARIKALVEVYAARAGLYLDMSFVDEAFVQFALGDYQKLSGLTSSATPIILPKVLDYIAKDKAALVVLDGMSLFDFHILAQYFDGIKYELQDRKSVV